MNRTLRHLEFRAKSFIFDIRVYPAVLGSVVFLMLNSWQKLIPATRADLWLFAAIYVGLRWYMSGWKSPLKWKWI